MVKIRRRALKRYDLLSELKKVMRGMGDEDIMAAYVIANSIGDCTIQLPGKKMIVIENRRIVGVGIR